MGTNRVRIYILWATILGFCGVEGKWGTFGTILFPFSHLFYFLLQPNYRTEKPRKKPRHKPRLFSKTTSRGIPYCKIRFLNWTG